MDWFSPLIATLILMLASVTIATVVGIAGAWAMETSRSGSLLLRRVVGPLCLLACVVAVLSPLILHATAWEATAGKFGFTMLTQTGTRATSGDQYSFFAGGIATAWIHGVHGSGIILLAMLVAVRRTPRSLLDRARMTLSPASRFWKIDLPLAFPWCGSAMVVVAMLAATEMTVADLYGYRTLADQFYLYFAIDADLMSVFAICFWPIALAAGLIVLLGVSGRRLVRMPAHREDPAPAIDEPMPFASQCAAALVMIAVALLLAVVPMVGLVNKLGQSVSTFGPEAEASAGVQVQWSLSVAVLRLLEAPSWFASEYQWTFLIAVTSGVTATMVAWPIVSVTHLNMKSRTVADLSTVLLFCIPGPVVGMVVFRCFQQDVPGFRFLIQQTIFPTVIACLARAIPIAYWVLRASYASVSPDVLDAAKIRMGSIRRFWVLERLMVKRFAVIAVVVAAVFASGDLPATAPVVPAGITTVPGRLFGLLHSGARFQEATLAFWYLAGVTVLAGGVIQLSKSK